MYDRSVDSDRYAAMYLLTQVIGDKPWEALDPGRLNAPVLYRCTIDELPEVNPYFKHESLKDEKYEGAIYEFVFAGESWTCVNMLEL